MTAAADLHTLRQRDWFPIESCAEIMEVSVRTVRTRLAGVRPSLLRTEPNPHGTGRPHVLIHFAAFPQLTAYREMQREHDELDARRAAEPESTGDGISPDDMARAILRVTAVKEYLARRKLMSAADALAATCADWARNPRTRDVEITERIGAHRRKHACTVDIAPFQPGALRAWAATYAQDRSPAAQAPRRKGHTGRPRVEIPDDLVRFVLAMSASGPRATVSGAVRFTCDQVKSAILLARPHWTGDWPECSYQTWRRRIRELDPAKVAEALGKRGTAAFANTQSPDVERDWDSLTYNELWEIDDVQLDWYRHSAVDPTNLLRPYIYGIRRVSTRQWVAFVESEAPITHAQVCALLAYAFIQPQGGLPDHITFERGTVSLSDNLRSLLDSLEVRYHQNRMDGGRTWSGAVPDASAGHARSKAVFEANVRRLHNIMWNQTGQVGTEERNTKPQNLDAVKAESIRRVRDKLPTILPLAHESRAYIRRCMELDNNTPHTGLKRIWDDKAGDWRHQTPNERAIELGEHHIRRMDERLIPAFLGHGQRVQVTPNGIQIGQDFHGRRRWYGRCDSDLDARRGSFVTAYVHADFPELCFVAQLGRCVQQYEREAPTGRRQYAQKVAVDQVRRNQFEQLMSDAAALEGSFILQSTQTLTDPTPDRPAVVVSEPGIMARIDAVQRAAAEQVAEQAAVAEQFAFDRGGALDRGGAALPAGAGTDAIAPRRGLLSRAVELRGHVAALAGMSHNPQEDTCKDGRFSL